MTFVKINSIFWVLRMAEWNKHKLVDLTVAKLPSPKQLRTPVPDDRQAMLRRSTYSITLKSAIASARADAMFGLK